MENKIMRCPFRKGEDGEFAECYEKMCMAYTEKERIDRSPEGEHMRVYISVCRMLPKEKE